MGHHPIIKREEESNYPYSNELRVCKYPGCDTVLNGYTVGRKCKYCGPHKTRVKIETGE